MTSLYPSTTLVVVDSTVQDYEALIDSVSVNTEIVVLDAEDGIEQVTALLRNYRELSSLHILTHGEPGAIWLGNTRLSLETLERYAHQIQSWAKAIATDASVLLYGCRVAAGSLGATFVHQLSRLISAPIAASTTLTGNAALGGNWSLEFATGEINTPLAFSAEAVAAYPYVLQQVLLTETFTGDDVAEKAWLFGVDDSTRGQANPFLTARSIIDAPEGGLPGNPGTAPYPPVNTPGYGVLRLTNATNDQAAYVLFNRPFSSSAGLLIEFDFFSYGGTGADGFSFFLADGSNPPEAAGGFGGSLGYAQIDANFQGNGVAGGYLGIGFDEYGNYSNPTESRVGGIGFTPDAIAIRGSEANDYEYLTGSETLPFSIDVPDAATREDARRHARIELTPGGLLSVQIDANLDGDYDDEGESPEALQNFDVVAANGEVPDTFTLGFASGTGAFTNVHEIRNLDVSTTTDPPEVADVTNNVPEGTTVNLTGLSATDADGTIESYTIVTLPGTDQGVLYLGPPTPGNEITVGQVLTPDQITQLYFQPTGNFTGSSFTYNATDDQGAEDATPGTVTLALLSGDNTPPVADNLTVGDLNPDSTTRLPELTATDSDGTITSYTIVTLPNSEQGLLYVGDPASGGTLLNAGDQLTPDQIDQLFFQSNPNFTGGTFTFYATDNQGAVSNVATVTLDDETAVGGGSGGDNDGTCEPGIRRKGNGSDNTLRGTADIDTLLGAGGDDTIRGLNCPDLLEGGRGRDEIYGGNAGDTIDGNQDNDRLFGDNGNDTINGGLGNDRLDGGRGNDVLYSRRGDEQANGRVGDDYVVGERGKDTLLGGGNNDRIEGRQNGDQIDGGTGLDLIFGNLGSDTITTGRNADTAYGGRGKDRMKGNGGYDYLFGQLGNDRIVGGSQTDYLYGGDGNDTVVGGGGSDLLSGGSGRDVFAFRNINHAADTVIDFQVNRDRLDFSRILSQPEYTKTGAFAYIKRVQIDVGTIIQVDSNGNQAGGFVNFATLRNITAADFTSSNLIV